MLRKVVLGENTPQFEEILMDIHATTSSKNSSAAPAQAETKKNAQTLSAEKIRDIRKIFEQEIQPLQESLGSHAHQTMLVAMYEGTENLLNKSISEFEIVEYLESLKINAQELHHRGISEPEFHLEMLKQSQDSVFKLLNNI